MSGSEGERPKRLPRQAELSARQIAHISSRLRELRAERGLSMRALADMARLSSGTVSALERGVMEPALGTMLALQAAFGLDSIESLLGSSPSVALSSLSTTAHSAVLSA